MLRFAARVTLLLVALGACAEADEFNAAPDSFTASTARIDADTASRIIASVDSSFFGATAPLLGRLPAAQEYADGSTVAVISSPFWMERFGGRPDVIGSTLTVNGVPRMIVGIMPDGVDLPEGVALWIPRGR